MKHNTLILSARDAAQTETALTAPAKRLSGLSRLLSKVDAKAPAKDVRWAHERTVVKAKMTRHGVTRDADIFDEVTEQAIWFGDGFAVVVPFARLDGFRSWVSTRGMAPGGRTYEVDALVTTNVGWERVFNAVKA